MTWNYSWASGSDDGATWKWACIGDRHAPTVTDFLAGQYFNNNNGGGGSGQYFNNNNGEPFLSVLGPVHSLTAYTCALTCASFQQGIEE